MIDKPDICSKDSVGGGDPKVVSIGESLKRIRSRMAAAALRAGRGVDTVHLVAVSKTQSAEKIREAYTAGQRIFGENYAQELRDKARELADLEDLQFHFIGTLQKNKVKYVASVVSMFQALDQLELAQELNKRVNALGRVLPVLVEVNLGEEQKGGVLSSGLPFFLDSLQSCESLRVEGLMCIPPHTEGPDNTRESFRQMSYLCREQGLAVLSMGMSSDFEMAIEEGATHVRVGTAIFGERA